MRVKDLRELIFENFMKKSKKKKKDSVLFATNLTKK